MWSIEMDWVVHRNGLCGGEEWTMWSIVTDCMVHRNGLCGP